jgi:hypothetical protein
MASSIGQRLTYGSRRVLPMAVRGGTWDCPVRVPRLEGVDTELGK